MRRMITALALVAGVVWLGAPGADATNETRVERLRLTFIQECGTGEGAATPPTEAIWRIRNSNSVPVDYTLSVGWSGSGTAPVGDSFFTTPWGARTVKLTTVGGGQDTKAGGDTFLTAETAPEKCAPPSETTQPSATTQPPVVCVDTFENDGSSGCPPPTTIDEPATVPSTTPLPEACIQHQTGGADLPQGEYQYFNSTDEPGATGTTRWSVVPCGPISAAAAPTPPSAAPQSLPETGAENWVTAVIATLLVVLGGGVLLISRRGTTV